MGILDDDFEIKIAAMRAGVADVEFTASKQKYKIAKIEKNNTLLFAFGQKGPLVLTIVSLSYPIKVGCVFPMIVVSILLYPGLGRNDYREDVSHFNKLLVQRTANFNDDIDLIESVIYYLDRGRKMYCCWIRR